MVRCPEQIREHFETENFFPFSLPGREHPGWLGRGPVGGPRDRPGTMGKRQKTGKEVDLEGFEKLLGKLEKALSKVLEEAESEGKAEKVRGALFSSHNGLRSVHQLTAFTPLSPSLRPSIGSRAALRNREGAPQPLSLQVDRLDVRDASAVRGQREGEGPNVVLLGSRGALAGRRAPGARGLGAAIGEDEPVIQLAFRQSNVVVLKYDKSP